MRTEKVSLTDFMTRFGEQFFDGARVRMMPEYEGGRDDLDQLLAGLGVNRVPFPAQSEAAKAMHVHLHERNAKMAFLEAEMGCGKTTVATIVALMRRRPNRTIVVCPPHLVGKWAREIAEIAPRAKVVKINSAGANRILAQAAAANPGPPERHEFWIIGRVRLRMNYRIESALVPRQRPDGFPSFRCPDCGAMPVQWKRLSQDEDLPPEAIVVEADGDDESDTANGFYANLMPSELSRTSFCEKVAHADGSVGDGCGTALWQAKRNRQLSPQQNALQSLRQLPGVGKRLAEALSSRADAAEIVQSLEDGDLPKALSDRLGRVRRKRIRAWLEHNVFSLQASDFAPVRMIHKRLPRRWFEHAIFDEVHEFKGDNSAQGVAYGVLAGVVDKVICLTGTLVDGYAQSLHPLLFRADPRRMLDAGYGDNEAARFQWEMGVIKEVKTETLDDGHKSSRSRSVRRQRKNLPGLHPRVVTELLLPNTVFLTLADIERSIQDLQPAGEAPVRLLPSYREVFVSHPMDRAQYEAVTSLSAELMDMLKKALARGGGNSLMAPIISSLLRYPDDCFRPLEVSARGELIAERDAVQTHDGLLPKERFMIDLARRERDDGRKLVVFTTYTDRRDLSARYKEVLESAGIKAAVLKSSVPTDQREAWMAQMVRQGYEAIVCNPELVKTGLDLYDFPTLYFTQTGYRTDTILQASRRSWRIGQQRPVRVYFAGYEDSPQMTALKLVAKKIRVANQAKGDIADTGLSTLDDDEEASAMQAIANAILDERRDRTHDALTGSIRSVDADDTTGEFGADSIERLYEVIRAARCSVEDAPVVEQSQPASNESEFAEQAVAFAARPDDEVVDLFDDFGVVGPPREPARPPASAEAQAPTEDEAAVAPDTGAQRDGERGAKRIILVDYLERKGKKRQYKRVATAIDEVPAGSQMAMF